jgi:hypothetical protein
VTGPEEKPDEERGRPESDWERRRRLAEVFGDNLPDTTSDERDLDERPDDAARRTDTWLEEQVPPHHGG